MTRPGLTATGRGVALGSVLLGLMGWSLSYPELTALALAGLAATVLAWLWVRSLPHLDVTRRVRPSEATVGTPVEVELAIRNPGGRRTPARWTEDRLGAQRTEVLIPRLAPGAEHRTRYQIEPEQRGAYPVGPLVLDRRDPFGLARSRRPLGDAGELVVLPRTYAVTPLPAGQMRDLDGPTVDRAEGSITFQSLREYVPGDDLRRIHWRSSARLGSLMVRQHVDSSQPSVAVVLDTAASSYAAQEFEAAVEAAASLVLASTANRYPVRLVTTSGELLVDRAPGRPQRGSYRSLATVATHGSGDLERVARAELAASSLVVITGSGNAGARATVADAAGSGRSAVVVELVDGALGAAGPLSRGGRWLRAADGPSFASVWNRTNS